MRAATPPELSVKRWHWWHWWHWWRLRVGLFSGVRVGLFLGLFLGLFWREQCQPWRRRTGWILPVARSRLSA
jgi:hypothetical protein